MSSLFVLSLCHLYSPLSCVDSMSLRGTLNEIHPLICRGGSPPTEMHFEHDTYTSKRAIDFLDIKIKENEFSNCELNEGSNPIPDGLTFNRQSCHLFGIVYSLLNDYRISIKSTSPFVTTASFSLTVTECTEQIIEIERQYGNTPYLESFQLIEERESGPVVLHDDTFHYMKKADTLYSQRFCVSSGDYRLELNGSEWNRYSGLTVSYILEEIHPSPSQSNVNGSDNGNDNMNGNDDMKSEPSVFDKVPMIRATSYQKKNTPLSYSFSLRLPLLPNEEWSYFFNSIPSDWTSCDTSSWQKKRRDDTAQSTNQIQLYRTSFSIDDSSLSSSHGFSLSLRYRSGVVVILNGNELFRDNLSSGDLTLDSVSLKSYNETKYRTIVFPTVSLSFDGSRGK